MRLSLQEREYAASFSPVCGNSNVALTGKRQQVARCIPGRLVTMDDPLPAALRTLTRHKVREEDIHGQSFFLQIGIEHIFDVRCNCAGAC
jgi:hypothetical protein